MVNGLTPATHGVSPGADDGGGPGSSEGVGLHSPIAALPRKGAWSGGKRPSFERKAKILAAAWAPTPLPGSLGSTPFVTKKLASSRSSVGVCTGNNPTSTS